MKTTFDKIEGFILEEYKDGTGVLLHSESGIVHLLNTTSAFLYKLLDTNTEKEKLFDSFISGLDLSDGEISKEEIRVDLENVLNEFVNKGILNCNVS